MAQARITEIRLDRTFNLENFNSIKIGLTATLRPGEYEEDLISQMSAEITRLRAKALKAGRPQL